MRSNASSLKLKVSLNQWGEATVPARLALSRWVARLASKTCHQGQAVAKGPWHGLRRAIRSTLRHDPQQFTAQNLMGAIPRKLCCSSGEASRGRLGPQNPPKGLKRSCPFHFELLNGLKGHGMPGKPKDMFFLAVSGQTYKLLAGLEQHRLKPSKRCEGLGLSDLATRRSRSAASHAVAPSFYKGTPSSTATFAGFRSIFDRMPASPCS